MLLPKRTQRRVMDGLAFGALLEHLAAERCIVTSNSRAHKFGGGDLNGRLVPEDEDLGRKSCWLPLVVKEAHSTDQTGGFLSDVIVTI